MKNIKQNIIMSLATLMAVLVICFIISPTLKKIKNLNLNIYNQRKALEKTYIQGKNLKKTREDFEKIKNQVNLLDQVFINSGQALDFITFIEKSANQNNIEHTLNILNDDPSNVSVENKNYEEVRVNLSLTGTFADLMSFLDKLQSADFYYNLDEISFYNSDSSSSRSGKTIDFKIEKSYSSQISANISGITYWR